MFPQIAEGRFKPAPGRANRLAHFLGRARAMHLHGTGPLQVTQILVDSIEGLEDRILLREHAIKAVSGITALKQIDKQGDEKKQDGHQKGYDSRLRQKFHEAV